LAIKRSWGKFALRRQITLPAWMHLRKKLWHQRTPWTDGLSNLFGCVQEELLSQWRALAPDSLAYELALKDQTAEFTEIMVPAETLLPRRLMRGKECEELAKEIDAIRNRRVRGGLTVAEIQTACSSFKIWNRVEVLSPEDKDTFMHPGTWESGYANLLLGKLYADTRHSVAAATIDTWRKEYRAYLKWEHKNPTRTAGDFFLELKARKLSYRKRVTPKAIQP
jgi:transposase-like protein